MPSYLLLLNQIGDRPRPSPDEQARMREAYLGWAARMRAEGRVTGGEKLTEDPGRVMQRRQERTIVTDGPFAESKELIAGFFLLEAADYDEACRLAESCPHLAFGGRIEVRQIEKI